MSTPSTDVRPVAPIGVGAIVGLLVCVEFASGILQGYYTPIYTNLAHHLSIRTGDVNWFEAAQLIVSALALPPLARLGDMVGHKRVLVIATAVTALGSWWLVLAPSFGTFLAGWAIQGAYTVWLPLEVAIVYGRTGGDQRLTRRAAAVLVGVLELSVIVGAGLSGALVDGLPMSVVLAIPALAVTAVLVVVAVGLEDTPGTGSGAFDWSGTAVLTLLLGLVMGGLVAVRVQGPGSWLAWTLVALGLLACLPFWRVESRAATPLVDVRLLATRGQWPVQVASGLFGMSVLGAQIPLSTFARTKPSVAGYGLGAGAGFVSVLIAVYVIVMAVGAFGYPVLSRRLGPVGALVAGSVLVAAGYAAWLPFHAHTWQGLVNMAIAGLGSGALVAALPATAAGAAPPEHTAFATGMTNATKTVGGAVASAIFAIALAATGSIADPKRGHAPLSGYLTVWAVCAAAALVAAAVLAGAARTRTYESPERPSAPA